MLKIYWWVAHGSASPTSLTAAAAHGSASCSTIRLSHGSSTTTTRSRLARHRVTRVRDAQLPIADEDNDAAADPQLVLDHQCLFPITADSRLRDMPHSDDIQQPSIEVLLHDSNPNPDSDDELDLPDPELGNNNEQDITDGDIWDIGLSCDLNIGLFEEPPLYVRDHERFTQGSTPLDFFKLFFDDEVLALMVMETNRYASAFYSNQQAANTLVKEARQFTACTILDMKKFFLILLVMGRSPQPSMDLYWKKNQWFSNHLIRETMPLVRFQQMLRFLHFVDNNNTPDRKGTGYDHFWKIRPLIDLIRHHFHREAILSQDISHDEIMVPYKGRHSAKQYMKDKPTRWGFKLYGIGSTKGYLADFEPYMGKSYVMDLNNISCEAKELLHTMGESSLAVVRLIVPYLNKHHIVHVDNFYLSIPLVK